MGKQVCEWVLVRGVGREGKARTELAGGGCSRYRGEDMHREREVFLPADAVLHEPWQRREVVVVAAVQAAEPQHLVAHLPRSSANSTTGTHHILSHHRV